MNGYVFHGCTDMNAQYFEFPRLPFLVLSLLTLSIAERAKGEIPGSTTG